MKEDPKLFGGTDPAADNRPGALPALGHGRLIGVSAPPFEKIADPEVLEADGFFVWGKDESRWLAGNKDAIERALQIGKNLIHPESRMADHAVALYNAILAAAADGQIGAIKLLPKVVHFKTLRETRRGAGNNYDGDWTKGIKNSTMLMCLHRIEAADPKLFEGNDMSQLLLEKKDEMIRNWLKRTNPAASSISKIRYAKGRAWAEVYSVLSGMEKMRSQLPGEINPTINVAALLSAFERGFARETEPPREIGFNLREGTDLAAVDDSDLYGEKDTVDGGVVVPTNSAVSKGQQDQRERTDPTFNDNDLYGEEDPGVHGEGADLYGEEDAGFGDYSAGRTLQEKGLSHRNSFRATIQDMLRRVIARNSEKELVKAMMEYAPRCEAIVHMAKDPEAFRKSCAIDFFRKAQHLSHRARVDFLFREKVRELEDEMYSPD